MTLTRLVGITLLVAAVKFSFPAVAEVAGDGSNLPGAVRIARTTHLPPPEPNPAYTHRATVNVYLTRQHAPSLGELRRQLARAQQKFDRCRIQLRLGAVHHLAAPDLLAEWESIEFNAGVTFWERTLFSLTVPFSTGIVYVERVDWTIGDDGVIAVGYGPFVVADSLYFADAAERAFFRRHVVGHAVLGRSSGVWTLAHELGHAVMGLRHSDDRDNVMFGGQLARSELVEFEEEQCARGRANAPWVQRVGR